VLQAVCDVMGSQRLSDDDRTAFADIVVQLAQRWRAS
jgi:hypothetical protein